MIRVHGLEKRFGPHVALAGVDLAIEEGERVMLVGPNGAGKTTLLRILATLSRPTAGTVRISGLDPGVAGGQVRSLIGFVSHETLLYDDLTAWQNLRFYATMYGLAPEHAGIDGLLTRVGLEGRRHDLIRTFSRGMQQRLAVVRALIHKPRLLLLDEPYTGLDPLAVDTLTELLAELVDAGCTLLLTTHQPAAEGRLAERVIVLRRGRIITDESLGDAAAFPARYRELLREPLSSRGFAERGHDG